MEFVGFTLSFHFYPISMVRSNSPEIGQLPGGFPSLEYLWLRFNLVLQVSRFLNSNNTKRLTWIAKSSKFEGIRDLMAHT